MQEVYSAPQVPPPSTKSLLSVLPGNKCASRPAVFTVPPIVMASAAHLIPDDTDEYVRAPHVANAALPFAAKLDSEDGAVDDGDIHAAISSFLALPNSFWDSSIPPFLAVEPLPTNACAEAAGDAVRGAADESGGERRDDAAVKGRTNDSVVCIGNAKDANAATVTQISDNIKREAAELLRRNNADSSSLKRRAPERPPPCGSSNVKKQKLQQQQRRKAQQNAKILSALLTALASLDQCSSEVSADDESAPNTPSPKRRKAACGKTPLAATANAHGGSVNAAEAPEGTEAPPSTEAPRVVAATRNSTGSASQASAAAHGKMSALGGRGARIKSASLPGLTQQGEKRALAQGFAQGTTRVEEEHDAWSAKDEVPNAPGKPQRGGTGRSLLDAFLADLPDIDGHLDTVMSSLCSESVATACTGGVSKDNAACAGVDGALVDAFPQPSSHLSPPLTPVLSHAPGFGHVHEKPPPVDEVRNNEDEGDDEDDRLSTSSIDSEDAAAAAAAATALAMRTRTREAEENHAPEPTAGALYPDNVAQMKHGAGLRPPPLTLPSTLEPVGYGSPTSLGSPFNQIKASTPGNRDSPYAMPLGIGTPFLSPRYGAVGGSDMDDWMPRSRGRKDRQVAGGRIKARSMAERQRRERISEGLQKLRMVVRGHGDTATMLDNAVAYVQALQERVTTLETNMLLHQASCKMKEDGFGVANDREG
ncbi:unnamed protein product [Closterium sp. Yama58-4]|nr:unnamed protein product [Closterium sp. Yama58-4]